MLSSCNQRSVKRLRRTIGRVFSSDDVRHLLARTKTQHRIRVPVENGYARLTPNEALWCHDGKLRWLDGCALTDKEVDEICPFGGVGDTLFVKETFSRQPGGVVYRVGGDIEGKWTPPAVMQESDARFRLRITCLRFQPVSEMTEAEAIQNGLPPDPMSPKRFLRADRVSTESALEAYRSRWDGSWLTDLCWVLDFRVICRK